MKITIKDTEQVIYVNKEDNLYERLTQEGVYIPAICGGKGTCGKCKIRVLAGDVNPMTQMEKSVLSTKEQIEGYRLACKVQVVDGMCIEINSHDDEDRKSSLMKLPEWFKSRQVYKAQGKENVIESEPSYGVAFDIGTTTVVGALWNLTTKELVDVCAASNPQRTVGADVISRIQYCLEATGNEEQLSLLLHDCLNTILGRFYNRLKVMKVSNEIDEHTCIKKVCLVANTAMSRIAQVLEVKQLIKPPFPIGFYDQTDYKGVDTKLLVGEDTQVTYLAGIGGHVGSDITAMILATNLEEYKGTVLAIDIGTNGEIVLAKDGTMIACSTAAGPAFEGACIRYGMRADQGAIESVLIDEDGVTLKIINNDEAQGICGSGLVDALAAMLDIGVVDKTGRIRMLEEAIKAGVPKSVATRIQNTNQGLQFVLQYRYGKDPIVITQEDIRQVQLAKGAILAGVHILMEHLNIKLEEEIDQVYLAGAFGSYLKITSARRIGLLPNVALTKISPVGNAAGIGASMAVLQDDYLRKATEISNKTKQIELSMSHDFQQEFINCMNF